MLGRTYDRRGWLSALAIGPLLSLTLYSLSAASTNGPAHAVALHGEPKYPSGFQHLDYANPQAPKGGHVRLAQIGTFDSLNPFILKGVGAAGMSSTFDTLTYNSDDEAFTEYGLLAETIEVADDGCSEPPLPS